MLCLNVTTTWRVQTYTRSNGTKMVSNFTGMRTLDDIIDIQSININFSIQVELQFSILEMGIKEINELLIHVYA